MGLAGDDEDVLLPGAGPAEEVESVAVGAELSGDATDDDLEGLGQELVGEVEGVVADAGPMWDRSDRVTPFGCCPREVR